MGITASRKWKNKNGDTMVFAFDILLNDISNFTRNLRVSDNSISFILTEDDRVLGIKKNSQHVDNNTFKLQILAPLRKMGISELVLCYDEWKESGRTENVFPFIIMVKDGGDQ
jgi:hypothetical protein